MKFIIRLSFAFFLLGIGTPIFAQFQQQEQIALTHLQAHLGDWNLEQTDIENLHLKNAYQDEKTGATYLYFNQRYKNIPIQNAIFNVTLSKENEVVHVGNRLFSNIEKRVNKTQPELKPVEAILAAIEHLEISALAAKSSPVLKEKKNEKEFIFEKGNISESDIRVKLRFQPTKNGALKLAWNLSINMLENADNWSLSVDALSGEILNQNNLTVYCSFGDGPHSEKACGHTHSEEQNNLPELAAAGGSYRVFELPTESPNHGPHVLVTSPEDSTASPFGWHDVDGVEGADFTITRGNNAHAYLDSNNSGSSDGDEPDGGADLIFDFPFDENLEPSQIADASVTNLFYMTNMMHDIAYQYGFTEEAGNFQANNYGKNGMPNDYIIAEAQDGSGENNANFATEPDGIPSKMQMYLWNTNSNLLYIEGNEDVTGWYNTGSALYGPRVDGNTNISGEVVLPSDGVFAPSETDGCEPMKREDVEGKIVLIDRGTCFYEDKTLNAEKAGAIAVVICNYTEGAPDMRGNNPAEEPTIPTVSLSSSDCALLRQFLNDGMTATIMPRPTSGASLVASDFDNGIIAHEYAHGISHRLTGGADNTFCLFNEEQMGEGWSDFFALVTTAKESDRTTPRGVGTYSDKEAIDGRGIRPFQYSTDMSINPVTYEDASQLSIPHGLGSVWCSMLWDLYWAMADEYGFDADVLHGTGGNNMAIRLVMEGMRLQPCSPGFVDGRDAILAADRMLNNGDNQCLIWNVFARRGLGFNADQGSSNIVGDNVESFESMPSCMKELLIAKTATPLANAGDEITMSITILNNKDQPLSNVVVTDELPEGLTFSGVQSITGITSNLINVNTTNPGMVAFELAAGESLAVGQEVTITYNAFTDTEKYSLQMYLDDVPDNSQATEDRWFIDIHSDPDISSNIWRVSNNASTGDGWSWRVDDSRVETRQLLILAEPLSVSGRQPVLRFYHKYDSYIGQHGGVVELSTDGLRFENKADAIFRNSYSGLLAYQAFFEPYLYGFSGQSGADFQASYIDLSDFNNEDLYVRFRFGTRIIDEITGTSYNDYFNGGSGDGWFMDDFELMDMFNYDGEVCVTTAEGDNLCTKAPERGTIIESQLTSSIQVLEDGSELSIYPNPTSEMLHLAFDSKISRTVDVKIFTVSGKMMQSQTIRILEGNQGLNLEVGDYPAGFYFITIQSENGLITEKVVIE